jgi:hypothetical protein
MWRTPNREFRIVNPVFTGEGKDLLKLHDGRHPGDMFVPMQERSMTDHEDVDRAWSARSGEPVLNTAQAAICLGHCERLLERIGDKGEGGNEAAAGGEPA